MINADTAGELALTEYHDKHHSATLTISLSSRVLMKGIGKFLTSNTRKVLQLYGLETVYNSRHSVSEILGARGAGLWCHGITHRELSKTLTWVMTSLKQ